MGFLNNIFGKKEHPITSYADFWEWFKKNDKTFSRVVNGKGDIHKDFLNLVAAKLAEIKDELYYVTGMLDDSTAELVITADGCVKNFAFVEEIVNSAPQLKGWKFTALKPALDIDDVRIHISDQIFGPENIWFYANDDAAYPDDIDITVINTDMNKENAEVVKRGTYLFLDSFLGELNFATSIDELEITDKADTKKELIPIAKLKDYLMWREKEFVEKYEGQRHNTENDSYSGITAELESGNKLIALIDQDLLQWDRKASHPWILIIKLGYDGTNTMGMPDKTTYNELQEMDNELLIELKDVDGYLYIGRQTANSIREVYFACREFRKPSKVAYGIERRYADKYEVSYQLYKDKYWRTFNRFIHR